MKKNADLPKPDLTPYAGRWVALVHGHVAGVGWTSAQAHRAAKLNRPKETPQMTFVPPVTHITLPDWPWKIVRRLAGERGVRVWAVGGAVRDVLMSRPVHDWDFAVERNATALARAVADALDGAYFPLDAERDTGRAIVTSPHGAPVELDFAALRDDSLEADLFMRDFTVNALALAETGELIDPTGGQADLAAQLIRATHESTFRDDPVRLLRGVRLEANLGFEIEPQTADWLHRAAPLLELAAAERVRDEFARMLALDRAVVPLQRLDEFGLLARIIPELELLQDVSQSPPHRFDVWRHTLMTVDALEGTITAATGHTVTNPALADAPPTAWEDITRTLGKFGHALTAHLTVEISAGRDRAGLLKLAALLHDVGKPQTRSQDEDGRIHFYNHEPVGAQMAAARLRELRFSRAEVERARTIVGQHLRPAHLARAGRITRRAIYRYFRATGCGGVDTALLSLADHLATYGPNLLEQRWAQRLETVEILLTHYFERREETITPPPLLTGSELMSALALDPGPEIGRLLEALREAQAGGEVSTPEEALALAGRLLKAKTQP